MCEDQPDSPRALIKRFYSLQEERVQTYNLFEDGFAAYLKGAPNYNFPIYRNLVHEITQAFQGISQEIITIEKALDDSHNLTALASIIQKIQAEEKKKLEHTAQLQILRQNVIDKPGNDYNNEIEEIKLRIADAVEHINEHMEDLKFESEEIYDTPAEDR